MFHTAKNLVQLLFVTFVFASEEGWERGGFFRGISNRARNLALIISKPIHGQDEEKK